MGRRTALPLSVATLVALTLVSCRSDEPASTPPAGGAEVGDVAVAQAQGQTVAAEGVTVTGSGRVAGRPDTLRATVGVQVTREDVDEAFGDATAAADRVIEALREGGVAEEDIQTREFSVHPQRDEGPGVAPQTTGYTVRNLVEVTVRDVEQAGELLAAVADAGGDDARIEGLRWSLEDNDAQLRAAREAAFEDARTKAEHYASLAGRQLGALISITDLGSDLPPPTPVPEAAAAEQAAAPITPGEQEVGVQLQATWTLR